MTSESPDVIENVLYDDIEIGQSARLVRTLTLEDIRAFAAVSGDVNPAHLDASFANESMFHGVIGHGIEIHGPVKLHGEAAGVIEHAPLRKVVSVVRARQRAHGEGIEGVGGVNMKIAVERLSAGGIIRP